MNIVLIGYRGTGKTAVAGLLAEQFQLTVIHLDQEIERQAGQPIPEIVEQRGWTGFRDIEEEVVRRFAASDGKVIDCGGGVVEREPNFAVLRAAGPVFWLRADPETIVARIESDDQRPSLTGTMSFTEEVAEVLQRRTPLYDRLAHHTIETDQLCIAQVVGEIARHII